MFVWFSVWSLLLATQDSFWSLWVICILYGTRDKAQRGFFLVIRHPLEILSFWFRHPSAVEALALYSRKNSPRIEGILVSVCSMWRSLLRALGPWKVMTCHVRYHLHIAFGIYAYYFGVIILFAFPSLVYIVKQPFGHWIFYYHYWYGWVLILSYLEKKANFVIH